MTAQEQQYVDRAMARLQEPLELAERIKILRTLSQMFGSAAEDLEDRLIEIEALEV